MLTVFSTYKSNGRIFLFISNKDKVLTDIKLTNRGTGFQLTNHKQAFFPPSWLIIFLKHVFNLFTFCDREFLTMHGVKNKCLTSHCTTV